MQRLVNDADDPIDRKMLKEQRLDEVCVIGGGGRMRGRDEMVSGQMKGSRIERWFRRSGGRWRE